MPRPLDYASPKPSSRKSPLIIFFIVWNVLGALAGLCFAGLSAHAIMTGWMFAIIVPDVIAIILSLALFALPTVIAQDRIETVAPRAVYKTLILLALSPAAAIGVVFLIGILSH